MTVLSGLTWFDAAAYLTAGYVSWFIALTIYRLWLSPLSRFPGSPLARVTYGYEFYYDFFKPGQYFRRINEMHQRYGMSSSPSTSPKLNSMEKGARDTHKYMDTRRPCYTNHPG